MGWVGSETPISRVDFCEIGADNPYYLHTSSFHSSHRESDKTLILEEIYPRGVRRPRITRALPSQRAKIKTPG